MHVYTKPRGNQKAHKGHVITLPQDVQQLADVLQSCSKDLPVIVFTVVRKNSNPKDFVVRREKVLAQALFWLTGLSETGEPNNHLYQNFTIDHNALDSLPENGALNVTTVAIENDHAEGQEVGIDLGPNNLDMSDDKVYDENSEMSSFLPININRKKGERCYL